MDLAALKVQLKTWEKDFKAKHGRDPTKNDIKAVPAIADKYKQYSKARSAAPKDPLPEETFKTPKKPRPSALPPKTPSSAPPVHEKQETRFLFAASPSKLRDLIASRSFSGSPNQPARLSPRKQTPRTKARSVLMGNLDVITPEKVTRDKIANKMGASFWDAESSNQDEVMASPSSSKRPPIFSGAAPFFSLPPKEPAPSKKRPNAIPVDTLDDEAMDEDIAPLPIPSKDKGKGKADGRKKRKSVAPPVNEEDIGPPIKLRHDTEGNLIAEVEELDGGMREIQVRQYQEYRRPAKSNPEEDGFSDGEYSYTDGFMEPEQEEQLPEDDFLSPKASKVVKLQAKHRDDLVAELLQEPSYKQRNRQATGLLDLLVDEQEEEGDDDWDSDGEGWKDLGNGMMD